MAVSHLTVVTPSSAVDFFHIFNVTSTGDEPDASAGDNLCATSGGACTLRAAIQEANANDARGDTITFSSGLSGTITLSNGELVIIDDNDTPDIDDLIIQGPGARTLTVSGNSAGRVFRIEDNASVSISGLTITNGNSSPELFGGGILNRGTLALSNSTVSANTAPHGGGIQNTAGSKLTLVSSTISGNAATGTTTSSGEGGGIRDFSGSVTLTNSTISANTASSGGGIYTNDGSVTLTNSTVSANTATNTGGGILPVDLGEGMLSNTIIAGNSAPNSPDAGFVDSQGNNLIGNTTGSSGWATSDLQNVNPLLGPLQDSGGPTNTHLLLPASPAVDAANNTTCPPRDQRGVARKDGDGNGTRVCDIGAFERNDLTPPKVTTTEPMAGNTGLARNANLTATFSENMNRATLSTSTFKLFKVNTNKTTTQITALAVSSATNGLKATLNPDIRLAANTGYRAVLTTGSKDRAGNRLDQNPTASGSQPMVWTFTTGS